MGQTVYIGRGFLGRLLPLPQGVVHPGDCLERSAAKSGEEPMGARRAGVLTQKTFLAGVQEQWLVDGSKAYEAAGEARNESLEREKSG